MGDFSTMTERQTYIYEKRADFPLLNQCVDKRPLIYLDSAATSQKPQCVVDAIAEYYRKNNANVHRGVYELCQRATAHYEAARQTVRHFIGAQRNEEIIFTRGTTESINLVAHGFALEILKPGDEVMITVMEHHSNIVPWQLACERSGARLVVIPITDAGELDMRMLKQKISSKTRLVAVTHASNVLGTINPIKEIVRCAHEHDVPVLVDGAQAVAHQAVDVVDLDCDFYVFSAHKMYGPTGIGVLYGKEKWLNRLPPYQTGGDMIKYVTLEKTEFNVLPHKFEAGTPNVAGVIGMAEAIRYIEAIGFEDIIQHEQDLLAYALDRLRGIEDIQLIGWPQYRLGVISFIVKGVHAHDIATVLDQQGLALRAGHHCAMPLMDFFAIPATVRLSIGLYNQEQDIDALILALAQVQEIFPAHRGDNE